MRGVVQEPLREWLTFKQTPLACDTTKRQSELGTSLAHGRNHCHSHALSSHAKKQTCPQSHIRRVDQSYSVTRVDTTTITDTVGDRGCLLFSPGSSVLAQGQQEIFSRLRAQQRTCSSNGGPSHNINIGRPMRSLYINSSSINASETMERSHSPHNRLSDTINARFHSDDGSAHGGAVGSCRRRPHVQHVNRGADTAYL